jgi:threonine synthase
LDTVLAGLAEDGGLYVPETIPVFSPDDWMRLRGHSYEQLAVEILRPFVGDDLSEAELTETVTRAYAGFSHPARAPLVQIGTDSWVLELFHGPTLAFKDFALQWLGEVLGLALARKGTSVTIVGATSGDTGSAAIAGCAGRKGMEIVILHPHNRVSEVQRRQMTTVDAPNVHNIAIEGTFDDCQALVKAMFNDHAFRQSHRLAAVNSINWARILAQVVYYAYAALALGSPARAVSFTVPTGNFGDVYAGYIAKRMGLPIADLIVATGQNDILARFFNEGSYARGAVVPTLAPSIDIQVSSNFERLLFDLSGREGATVAGWMEGFAATGTLTVPEPVWQAAGRDFRAAKVEEPELLATISTLYEQTGMVVDPHTAVGIAAGQKLRRGEAPMVALATAHPAKFPDAVKKACGVDALLPPAMQEIFTREERYTVLPNEVEAVKKSIRVLEYHSK